MAARLRKTLGANLRRLRLDRGWSQEELAHRAGLHRTYISSVECAQRNISIDQIERLADAFDTLPSNLFAGTQSDG